MWKRLRDEAPVYRNEEFDFYALSRYDDVLDGLLDAGTFLSSHGIVLEMIADERYENLPMMIMMDAPEHTKLRKLIKDIEALQLAAQEDEDAEAEDSP